MGGHYYGTTLDWSYKEWYDNTSMPGYIKKQLQNYIYIWKGHLQNLLIPNTHKKIDKSAKNPIAEHNSKEFTKDNTKPVQKIVGSILYYF